MTRVELLGILLGGTELAFPGALYRVVSRRPATDTERKTVRVLGARRVAQALLSGRISAHEAGEKGKAGSRTRWLVTAVDGSHAASMLLLAAASPRHRRAALASGTVALCFVGMAQRDPEVLRGGGR